MNRLGSITRTEGGGYVLRYERMLPQPPTEVWSALTDPSILSRWLLSRVEVDLRIGGRFVIHFFEGKERMNGTIVALEPGRLIEYSWREANAPESRVRWTVTHGENRATLLTLAHFLPAASTPKLIRELGGGWHGLLDSLATALSGGEAFYDEARRFVREAQYGEIYAKEFGMTADDAKEEGVPDRVASVRFERVLPGSIERVWAHLTDPKLLPGWFGEHSTIEPKLGGIVHLMGGHVRGVVTQWSPPQRLSYTWNVFGPNDGPDAVSAYPESYLSFTLESRGTDVLLTLDHLPVLDRFEKQNAMGWHTMLDILGAALRGEAIKPRGEYMKKNAALYGVDLANLQR